MKIGYKEIFDLYKDGDDFFICYALREAFGSDINSADFMKDVGVDMYDQFVNHGLELCIFMPRLNGYCGYYRKSQKRDCFGRFTKA